MNCRILIVDDSPLLRATARRALLEAGAAPEHVREAPHGEAALAALHAAPADLVLLDTTMPVMDGFRFLEEKAKDPALADVKVALVTAPDNGPRSARLPELGVCHYLRRPFEPDEVRALFVELFGPE